jgi:hypothetical protein
VGIAFIVLAVVVVIAAIVFIRIQGKRLEARAEEAFPEPLEGYSTQEPEGQGSEGRIGDGPAG